MSNLVGIMEKTLLWEAFASLTTAETREFGKFVRSPFFNARQQPIVLLEYLTVVVEAGRLARPEAGAPGRPTGSAT